MPKTPWVEKYAPKSASALRGQSAPLLQLKSCIQQKQPALVTGPVGCGKTAAAYALGHDLGYEVFEVNASDIRNKEHINQLIGGAAGQMSLFSKGKIVLIDEIDGIAGQEDRGGVAALSSLLDQFAPFQSFVLIANDAWERKIAPLRKKCRMIEFQRVDNASIMQQLKEIAEQEAIHVDEEVLKIIARRSNGDLRSAMTDLEMLSSSNTIITKEMTTALDDRERKQSMFNALQIIFQGRSIETALPAFDAVDADSDECFLWVEENVWRIYKNEALQHAFNGLSIADRFRGRIHRWQHWRFLVYVNAFLTAGVSLAKKEPLKGFFRFQPSTRLLRLYFAKARRMKKMAAAEKLTRYDSYSKLSAETFPYLKTILKKTKPGLLSQEEIEVLRK